MNPESSAGLDDHSENPVASLLVPLFGINLLLPNALVAEVRPYSRPEPVDGAPPWLLGHVRWRGETTMLIAFERADGKPQPDVTEETTIIILRQVASGGGHYALVAQRRPIPIRAGRGNLRLQAPAQADHPLVGCYVSIDGEHAAIPDLDALESLLREPATASL